MRASKLLVGVAVLVLLAVWSAGPAAAEDYEYIGVKKCTMCHKKPDQGNQLQVWEDSAHSKAFEVLASEKALEDAKKRGIANPQEAPECLQCHATAFHVMDALETSKLALEDGVSCEGCHGPGSGYYKKKTMEGIAAGEIEPASVGLTLPNEEMCTGCHKEEGNSFFTGFDFDEMYAKIAHPIPEAEEEEAGTK
jgi:hypothetical protein